MPFSSEVISRLAPTPSGFLHRGNAFSFLLTWLLVRKAGGKLALRIDDNDHNRFRLAYLEDIFYSLEWLGLDYDIGPSGPDDFFSHYSQVIDPDKYLNWLEPLIQQEEIYACSCSRKQIQRKALHGIYPGTCRESSLRLLASGNAWRVKVHSDLVVGFQDITGERKESTISQSQGDFVVKRKDGLPAYQLVSLFEDAQLGTNLIVRGQDLLDSSFAQLYLARRLHVNEHAAAGKLAVFENARFYHHPLLRDAAGQKLSKSAGSTSLKALREIGAGPALLYQEVANYLELKDTAVNSPAELLQAFKEKI